MGAAVLRAVHEWWQAGAGGAGHWSLEPVNYEGWRVSVDEGQGRKGWLLLRQSLHDPLLVGGAARRRPAAGVDCQPRAPAAACLPAACSARARHVPAAPPA